MFQHVLVAMDLSPATEALVSALPGLRDFDTRKLSLVHVAKDVEYPVSQSLRRVDELRTRLRKLAGRLEEEGFEVTVEVPSGSPAAEAVRLAQEREADVILVGSRSHTRIREAFLGSVAWEIVRRAHRPVLLQRIEASRPDPEAALEARGAGLPDVVVHPTDFSEAADRAFPWVEALARLGVPKVILLHCTAVSRNDRERGKGHVERDQARGKLEEIAARLRAGASGGGIATPVQIELEVRPGTASERVLALGGRSPDAMVVMGTQGRGFLPEMVMGSESRQVARQATAPVLLVPAPEQSAD